MVGKPLLVGAELAASTLGVGLTAREDVLLVRGVAVQSRSVLAAEPRHAAAAALGRPVLLECRLAPFDLELPRSDVGGARAELTLEIRQLGEILVPEPLVLLGEVPGESQHLVAVRVLRGDPFVALPRVGRLVRRHLQAI